MAEVDRTTGLLSSHSPKHVSTARKAPKRTYGRRPDAPTPSSPSEADKSSATLVAYLSPFGKDQDKPGLADDVQLSSSQETRIGDDCGNDTDNDNLTTNDIGPKRSDRKFSKSSNLLVSPSHSEPASSPPRRRSRSKLITNSTSPDDQEKGNERVSDEETSIRGYNWSWKEKLKKIDEDFDQQGSPSLLRKISDVATDHIGSPAVSSSIASPVNEKARLLPLPDLYSDSEPSTSGPSRVEHVARNDKSTSVLDRSEDVGSASEQDGKRKSGKKLSKGKKRATKIKPPTKKMIEEIKREQARLMARQPTSFPRSVDSQKVFTLTSLATRLVTDPKDSSKVVKDLKRNASSDPIHGWSSPADKISNPEGEASTYFDLSPKRNLLASSSAAVPDDPFADSEMVLPLELEDDDEEFLDLKDIVAESNQKREKNDKKKQLLELKRRVLEAQYIKPVIDVDADDDELEVVESRKLRSQQFVEGRRKPSAIVRQPWFGRKGGRTQEQHNLMLLQQAEKQREDVIKKKEEEWTRRGGRLQSGVLEDGSKVREYWLEKLTKKDMENAGLDDNASDQEGSDEEWKPLHVEPQSPALSANGNDNMASPAHEDEESLITPEHGSSAGTDVDESDNEDEQPLVGRQRNRARKSIAVESDEEEPSTLVPATPSLLRPSQLSPSPREGTAENETDKENDRDLVFDTSEDKENTLTRSQSRLSLNASLSHRGSPMLSPRRSDDRQPFKELRGGKDADLDSTWLSSGPRLRKDLADSDEEGPLEPALFLQGGFSQIFETQPGIIVPSQGRALDFDSPGTQRQRGGLDALRKVVDASQLSLTQDIRLQPALEVSDETRMKADAIFEREQNDLVQANMARNRAMSKPQLYVNENGFLTQNRPDSTNPEIYRPPLTQLYTQGSTQRQPLGTLAISIPSPFSSVDHDSDSDGLGGSRRKTRRLVRYNSVSPSPGRTQRSIQRISFSPSPSLEFSRPEPRPLDAFDALREGAVRSEKQKQKLPLNRSEFVEAEAQESDEDDGFGLAKKGDEEEESDPEDDDKPLEGLVNDTQMDAETEAKEKVIEKFKEHQEVDDANLEKYHRDAVEGKFRSKRRNRGVDFEDSDSELDDEEARELRRRIAKKRKINGDTLDVLAKNEETLPFVQAYENGLKEDDMFPILAEIEDVAMEDADEADDEEAEPRESISMSEIREQARRLAREEPEKRFDPSNISWLDGRDDDDLEDIRIRNVNRRKYVRQEPTNLELGPVLRQEQGSKDSEFNTRLTEWAKATDRKSTGSGFAPSGGSVTARPQVASAKQKAAVRNTRRDSRKMQKAESMLSAVSTKRNRFES